MTKKEELLIFIEGINEETQRLKTSEKIITSNVDSIIINDNDFGYKIFKTTNSNLSSLIANGFNDDLIGHVGTDSNLIEILEWSIIDK